MRCRGAARTGGEREERGQYERERTRDEPEGSCRERCRLPAEPGFVGQKPEAFRDVRVLALDYGAARTGVAVSDATGTIAQPLGVIERAASNAGLARVAEVVREQDVECVVVGLPLTLAGRHGSQALETEAFVRALREALDVPVETYDERFTTTLASRETGSRSAPEDARAAAHLLESYLARTGTR